jgi:hypothetical protein
MFADGTEGFGGVVVSWAKSSSHQKVMGVRSFNIASDRLDTDRLAVQNINEIRLQGSQYLGKLLRFK